MADRIRDVCPWGNGFPRTVANGKLTVSTCIFNTNNCQKCDGSTLDDVRRPVRLGADARHGAVVCRAIDEFRMRCERPGLELRPRHGAPPASRSFFVLIWRLVEYGACFGACICRKSLHTPGLYNANRQIDTKKLHEGLRPYIWVPPISGGREIERFAATGVSSSPTMGQRKMLGIEAFWAWPNAMRMRSDATPAIADGVHVIPRSTIARMRPSAPVHVLGMRQRFR